MDLLTILQQPFMQRALYGGLLIAILCAVIGIFITLKKQAFLSDAVAHASLSGVAIGILVSGQPLIFALIVGIFMAIAITYLQSHSKISIDALIGIIYSLLFALGVIIINLSPNYQPELFSYLFGSILAITWEDLLFAAIVFMVTMVTISKVYKRLVYLTFDRESAQIRGINVDALEYLITILSSITIIISLKIIGLVLVTALLIIPATTAKLLAKNFKQMLPLSILFSVISIISGIILSFYLSTPTGATVVVVSASFFLAIFQLVKLFKR